GGQFTGSIHRRRAGGRHRVDQAPPPRSSVPPLPMDEDGRRYSGHPATYAARQPPLTTLFARYLPRGCQCAEQVPRAERDAFQRGIREGQGENQLSRRIRLEPSVSDLQRWTLTLKPSKTTFTGEGSEVGSETSTALRKNGELTVETTLPGVCMLSKAK